MIASRLRGRDAGSAGNARRAAFSLIEVLVAMAVMAVSLTAIMGAQSTAAKATDFIQFAAIAPHLARTEMVELRIKLQEEGWSDFDAELEGDFADFGFARYRWKASIKKIEMELQPPAQTDDPMMAMVGQYVGLITDVMKESLREITVRVEQLDEDGGVQYDMEVTTHIVDIDKVRSPI